MPAYPSSPAANPLSPIHFLLCLFSLSSPHLTLLHLTSPHLTSHHLTSPHLTSRRRRRRIAVLAFLRLSLLRCQCQTCNKLIVRRPCLAPSRTSRSRSRSPWNILSVFREPLALLLSARYRPIPINPLFTPIPRPDHKIPPSCTEFLDVHCLE